MADIARLAGRLAGLKLLLADGTLTREEFEALKQKELQADGTDRGSDRGSDCASEGSASPAPVIGAPVYGAATLWQRGAGHAWKLHAPGRNGDHGSVRRASR